MRKAVVEYFLALCFMVHINQESELLALIFPGPDDLSVCCKVRADPTVKLVDILNCKLKNIC